MRQKQVERRPVLLPWWVVTVKYSLFAVMAGIVAWKGLTSLNSPETPATYIPLWCLALALGSVVGAWASLVERRSDIEKWSAVWITAWLAVVLVNVIAQSSGSSAGWFYVLIVTLLPAGRAIQLFSQKR